MELAPRAKWALGLVGVGVAIGGGILIYRAVKGAAVVVGVINVAKPTMTSGCQSVSLSAVPLNQHLELSMALSNPSSTAATCGLEAVIVDPTAGTIAGVWYAATHPQSGTPAMDDPAWYQFTADVPAGAALSAPTGPDYQCGEFGTIFQGLYSGQLQTVIYAAQLQSGYDGPIVTGKAIGAPVADIVAAAGLQVKTITGPGFTLVG